MPKDKYAIIYIMIKKLLILLILCSMLVLPLAANEISDQQYINQLKYRNNKLELLTKKRQIDERRSYSHTDIDTTIFSYEAYSDISTDVDTQSLSRSEVKEITEWYIYKGGVRELSDIEFLEVIEDQTNLARALTIENQKARMRTIGNIFIGGGILVMVGGAGLSAGQSIITAGALGMTAGFFISAFNLSPAHYIQPDYAQEKIDEYNIALKRKLDLPLDYN